MDQQEFDGFLVPDGIDVTHPTIPGYDLLENDLIVKDDNGTWYKIAPGLAVSGFVLTQVQEALLAPVKYRADGLTFELMKKYT